MTIVIVDSAPTPQSTIKSALMQYANLDSADLCSAVAFSHRALDGGRNDSDTDTETAALMILGMASITLIPEFGIPVRVMCVVLEILVVIARRPRQSRFDVYRI